MSGQRKLERACENKRVIATPSKQIERNGQKIQLYKLHPMR